MIQKVLSLIINEDKKLEEKYSKIKAQLEEKYQMLLRELKEKRIRILENTKKKIISKYKEEIKKIAEKEVKIKNSKTLERTLVNKFLNKILSG